jgi:phosphopantothenoylcysteine decarboxylase/phosphopantothenate--cysteine ligase
MHSAVVNRAFPQGGSDSPYDTVIMAAAVADYRPEAAQEHKVKKSAAPTAIHIASNPDILLDLGARKASSRFPTLVGFAVETGEVEDLLAEVRRKLNQKNADLMIGNLAQDSFDLDTNRVWLINRAGREQEISTTYKSRIAVRIFDAIAKLY